ncbi:MAG TPA: hypothetical protein V6D07_17020 [Trichocoleus sp.]
MRALTALGFLVAFGVVGVLAVDGMKSQSATSPAPASAQVIERASDTANTMRKQAYQQQRSNQQP